jgi:hypothetical protein
MNIPGWEDPNRAIWTEDNIPESVQAAAEETQRYAEQVAEQCRQAEREATSRTEQRMRRNRRNIRRRLRPVVLRAFRLTREMGISDEEATTRLISDILAEIIDYDPEFL